MTFKPTILARDIISVQGPDAAALLDTVLAATVAGAQPGEIRFNCILTPQGKVVDTMFLHKLTNGFVIDCFAGRGQHLVKSLNSYRMRARVSFEKVPGGVFVGPPEEAPDNASDDPRLEGLGKRWFELGPMVSGPKSPSYFMMLRKRGIPEFGLDYMSGDVFPTDVNIDLQGGIDYKKGCFVGQEVASRMKRKGEIRKRTLQVYLDKDLPRGTSLRQKSGVVGTVSSMIAGEGLAIMRMDRLDGDEAMALIDGYDLRVKIRTPDYVQ
ncbi:MAG: hypothetical protein AAFR65_05305 [Pseudomonadota bacterium]